MAAVVEVARKIDSSVAWFASLGSARSRNLGAHQHDERPLRRCQLGDAFDQNHAATLVAVFLLGSVVRVPCTTDDADEAGLAMLETALTAAAMEKALAAGVETPQVSVVRDIKQAEIVGQQMFIEATLRVTASGRPRIAAG